MIEVKHGSSSEGGERWSDSGYVLKYGLPGIISTLQHNECSGTRTDFVSKKTCIQISALLLITLANSSLKSQGGGLYKKNSITNSRGLLKGLNNMHRVHKELP